MICTVIEVWEWITMYHQYNMFTHSMHATGKQGSWCKPVNKTNWHQVPRVSTSYLDMCSYQVISVLNPLLLSVCVRKLAYEAKQQHWTCYETQLFRCVPFISFVWNWSTEKWLMHWVNLEKKKLREYYWLQKQPVFSFVCFIHFPYSSCFQIINED